MDPLPTYTQINAISSRLYPASDPFVGEDESKSSPKSKHTKNLKQTDLTRAPLKPRILSLIFTVSSPFRRVHDKWKPPIPLTHFWISATCGENKYSILYPLLEIEFFSPISH